ncbi:MAG: diphthine synthase, partial [Candidatus Thorarchaeota archaeon]
FLKRDISLITRKSLEENSKIFLMNISNSSVAILVSGDPFIATTHYYLLLEALELKIDVQIINNVSIYSIIPSLLGLSAYKFGRTSTITFQENYSLVPYDILGKNLEAEAHSLFLLDIDTVNKRFLSINEAINYLFLTESKEGRKYISNDTLAVAIARLGFNDFKIIANNINNLKKFDWTEIGPPQALVIPCNLSKPEEEVLFRIWGENGTPINFSSIGKKKIVVTGSFDIIHPGHLQFLREAKNQFINSELIVVVARDSSIRELKSHDPVIKEDTRLELVQSLKCVDKAILGNEGPDKIKIIEDLKPDLIVLGYDQWISVEKLETELKKRNLVSKVIRLPKYGKELTSSSDIRKKIVKEYGMNPD